MHIHFLFSLEFSRIHYSQDYFVIHKIINIVVVRILTLKQTQRMEKMKRFRKLICLLCKQIHSNAI